jgi:serine/threonine protein phosphatase PrpC
MEDMVVLNGRFMDRDDNDYLAVFDGHGGADTSHFCAQNLHVEFQRLLVEQGGKDVNDTAADCLKEAFLNIQRRIVSESVGGGSTGIVAFTTHDRVFIANAGDSRAIVGRVLDGARTGPVHRLSTDHKPDLPAEEERIRAAGGTVTKIAALFAVMKANIERAVDVNVKSAFELTDDITAKLESALATNLDRQVRVTSEVDQSLIGGVVIRAGDTIIDGSVRGRLAKLAEAMNS